MSELKCAAAVCFQLLAAMSAAYSAEFSRISAPPGLSGTRATDISADGTVVAGFLNTAEGRNGSFRWTRTQGVQVLPYLPGGVGQGQAFGISANGVYIVGTSSSGVGFQAYRWSAAEGVIGLGDLPGGNFGSQANSVSGDGSVVVGQGRTNSGNGAFRWTSPTGIQALGSITGMPENTAQAVSDDGLTIVGGSTTSPTQLPQGFKWTAAGGMQLLGDLPGGFLFSLPNAVSPDGSVIVGSSSSSESDGEMVRWTTSSGIQALLPSPKPYNTQANDVSADGSVMVGFVVDSLGANERAIVWDDVNGLRDIRTVLINNSMNLTGWSLREATAVSNDGLTITGWGTNPSGQIESWVAVIPEPSALLGIVAISLPLLGCRLRR
jgi:uncharacterized membrane protein